MLVATEKPTTQVITQRPRVDIEKLVNTKLPPSPGGIMRLTNLLRDENSSTRKISEAVSYEPVLVARILQLANSAIYALEKPVYSVHAAIDAIGTQAVYDIVMIELASATFGKEIRNSVMAKKVWEHSLAVAVMSREIAKALGMRGVEEAFTCGLLHDIGKLILIAHDIDACLSMLDKHDEHEMLEAELALFGYSHSDVGARVAQRWNLQEEVVSAIMYHHNPQNSPHARQIGHIIQVADIIANLHGYGMRLESESKLDECESIGLLRLSDEMLNDAWQKASESMDDVIRTFS